MEVIDNLLFFFLKNKMKGGNRVIPKYTQTNSFVSKDNSPPKPKSNNPNFQQNKPAFQPNKPAFQQNKPSFQPNMQNPNDLISLNISKDLLGLPQQVPPYKQIYPAPYVPVNYPMPKTANISPHFTPYGIGDAPNFFTSNNVPVINNYTIDTSKLNSNNRYLNHIYEDMLPYELKFSHFSSINERFLLYTFLRSTFIRSADGEYITLSQEGGRHNTKFNLLDKIKLMEFNPYGNNQFTGNPFKDLSDDMIMYKSCYPMTFLGHNGKLDCNNKSIKLNIRIYDINMAELCAKRISDDYDWHKFDLWREIGFYEYIREKIIKKCMSTFSYINFLLFIKK